MELAPEQHAILASGQVRTGVFLRIRCADDSVIRLWSGHGDCPMAEDAVETEADAVATGFGELLDVPALSQVVNGQADRIVLTIGTTSQNGADAARLALGEAELVRKAPAHVGVRLMDDGWQPVGGMIWLWRGTADAPSYNREDNDGQIQRVLSLSLSSGLITRKDARFFYLTDASQRRVSATDRWADRIDLYSRGTSLDWPR